MGGDDGVGWLLRELREKGGGTTPAARQIIGRKLPGRVVARLVRGLGGRMVRKGTSSMPVPMMMVGPLRAVVPRDP